MSLFLNDIYIGLLIIESDGRVALTNEILLASQFLEVERAELDRLWRLDKISFEVKSKLTQQLYFRATQLC
jgi:hypothetical protein